MRTRAPSLQSAARFACLLAMTGVVTAQEPTPTPPTQQKSTEQRLAELEALARQGRLGVQPQEAAFRTSWVSVDTAGVPDLQDAPKAPGVQSTVDLKLWGRVNFAGTYDNFQGSGGVGGADFMNFLTKEGDEELNFNGRDTRFGFAASNSWDDWTGRAVVELDFYGDTTSNNLAPRLRLGYVELANKDGFSLRAGQDWVPIAQMNPGTIDFGILSWGGNLWNRVPQVTARLKKESTEFLVSAMHFRVGGIQDQQERMPWLMARFAWTGLMDNKGLLAIGGGIRDASVSNAAGTASNDVTNHVIAIEAKLPVCSEVTLTGEGWTGQGIGREFFRTGLDYNATGEEIGGMGGFVSLEWKCTEKMSFNAGVGVDQPKDEDTTATTLYGAAVPYDMNRAVFANVRYQMSKQFGFGAEVIDFQTELVDGLTATDDGQTLRGQRFTVGTWFIF
jgi:hypothetical protein